MKLSLLAILLGAGLGLPQLYAFANPKKFAATVRSFPRNLPAGILLMLVATAWFVWNVNIEPVADFSAFKPAMMTVFAAIGILSCFFVQDFLAVRGLAVVFLLLAKAMVDTGRPSSGPKSLGPGDPGLGLSFGHCGNVVYRHALEIARLSELDDGNGRPHQDRQRHPAWFRDFYRVSRIDRLSRHVTPR